jgi:hypothetical protein
MIAALHDGQQALASLPRGGAGAAPPDVRMGIPNDSWSHDELGERADWEVSKLCCHRDHCPTYWWIGKVMLLVELGLTEQEREAWRKDRHINRTCAYRSLLLVEAFDSPDELHGLTIREALRRASERLGRPAPRTEAEARIRRRLLQLKKKTLPDSLADLDGVPDVGRLLPLAAEAGELYRRFEEAVATRLRARATSSEG